jgi:molecular chaperone GrpE
MEKSAGSGEVDDLDARLEAIFVEEADPLSDALRERDEYLDDLRRLQAEFENYRKRMARQGEELTERAAAAVLERMLPVLDALDLARSHAGEPTDAVAAQLAEHSVRSRRSLETLWRETASTESTTSVSRSTLPFTTRSRTIRRRGRAGGCRRRRGASTGVSVEGPGGSSRDGPSQGVASGAPARVVRDRLLQGARCQSRRD